MYLIDRPGSVQSRDLRRPPHRQPKANADDIAIETMNDVLGGAFTSRINMNLREDKHWSYGASTPSSRRARQRPFIVYRAGADRQDRAVDAEIKREIEELVGRAPAHGSRGRDEQEAEHLDVARSLGDRPRDPAGPRRDSVQFDLPEDHWNQYPARIERLTLDQVRGAARTYLVPGRMVWVVIGDRKEIEPGIRGLDLGEVMVLDADGEPVPPAR